MMHRRTSLTLATALLAAAVLAGCTPTPEPTPTPTALFASEDEAYAAAEATVRAYVDALNAERGGDENVDSLDWLTGRALVSEQETRESDRERGFTITGTTDVLAIEPVSHDAASRPEIVVLNVCIDVQENRIVDATGADVTSPDRPLQVGLQVTFHGSPGELLIADTAAASEGFTC